MNKSIKVLHFTTHDEACGIAKYQEQFIIGMRGIDDVDNVIFKFSPNQTKVMSKEALSKAIEALAEQLKQFDILHIQHELAFFRGDELIKIVNIAKKINKKVIVTLHTAPAVLYGQNKLSGLGTRSILHYLRQKYINNRFFRQHIKPISQCNLIIVHNIVTKNDLISRGVQKDKINIFSIPAKRIEFDKQSNEIKINLKYQKGDVIYGAVGFVSEFKGTLHAIKALEFLPENYKLAIIGGVHPNGANESFYDVMTDLIAKRNLQQRVYVTGYVTDDDYLNALIRECDMCVYPFENNFYSYVSSASLNDAISNFMPIIAYPTKSFIEVNSKTPVLNFCQSFNYYELAREIKKIDLQKSRQLSEDYAKEFEYSKMAVKFAKFYRDLA